MDEPLICREPWTGSVGDSAAEVSSSLSPAASRSPRGVVPQPSKATTLANDTGTIDGTYDGNRVGRQLSLLSGEVVDEIGAGAVVLAHVEVVNGLFEQPGGAYVSIDGGGGGVSEPEERLSIDLADHAAADLDPGIGPDHLQVQHEPVGLDRVHHVAQDVHDVLRLYSSERPGEDDEVERMGLDLDLLAGGNSIGDPVAECGR